MHLPLFLTDEDVASLEDWHSAISALRLAYREPGAAALTPPRAVASTTSGWLRFMPAAPAGGRFGGSKTISVSLVSRKASYLITLFDQHDGRLVALVDGDRITGLRTAATAAVAVSALGLPRRPGVAVIGSGAEAHAQLRAMASATELGAVRVFSPTEPKRRAFAERLSAELGLEITATRSAQDAVRDAELVLCAARSHDETPTVTSAWVRDDAVVVSVGSTTPSQRELDVDLLARASVIVADTPTEVLEETGDMIAATEAGVDVRAKTRGLDDLVAQPITSARGVRLYKSAGSGLQDIVIASDLYERAISMGLGTRLPVGLVSVSK